MAYTTINNGSLFMNPKIYTGNGGTQTITDINFEPDLIVTKGRDLGESPWWTDKVVGLTKYRYSDGGQPDVTYTTAVTGTNSDGYVLGNLNGFNNNTKTFVSWNWKAGTAVSGNTGGSGSYKAYSGSVNTTSGFSIIKYQSNGTSGITIPHHLGAVPKMIIFKNIGAAFAWTTYHHSAITASATNKSYLTLNTTDGVRTNGSDTTFLGVSTTTFTLGTDEGLNKSDNNYIAYCFAEVPGYSKFSSYIGNGNADGPFVYTGFKPAFVMTKTINAADDWQILDNKRNGFNPNLFQLVANSYNVEQTSGNRADFLSNGFKIRTSGGSWNPSG